MKHALLTYSNTGRTDKRRTYRQATENTTQSIREWQQYKQNKDKIETIKQWQLYNYKHIQEQHSEIISSPLQSCLTTNNHII